MPSRKPASETPLSYKPKDYAYTVMWSEEDQIYIGRVVEFPLLAAHGASPEAALKEITDVVRYVLEDLEESGEEIPPPLSKRHTARNAPLAVFLCIPPAPLLHE